MPHLKQKCGINGAVERTIWPKFSPQVPQKFAIVKLWQEVAGQIGDQPEDW